MRQIGRALPVLCLSLLLALPLAARTAGEMSPTPSPLADLATSLWERLTAPLSALWAASGGSETLTSEDGTTTDPVESTRGGWDPNG